MLHSADSLRSWPAAARDELLAVAHRDMAVARRNLADLKRYLDNQSTHLAACTGAMDDSIPLMSAETFSRVPGGIRSALAETQQSQILFRVEESYVLFMGPDIKLELCDCLSGPRLYYRQPPPREV